MRRISIDERRARLGVRHHLAPSARAHDALQVARGLVALHATDPASVYLAAAARMRRPDITVIEQQLYEERSLVRMLGMRRTMFVVSREMAAVVHAACTRAIAVLQRRRYTSLLGAAGFTDDIERWLADVEASTMRALQARGEATATELGQDEPRLRQQITLAQGKAYEGVQGVTTWVLFLLAAEGRIMRGKPRGSWISSQYRWSPTEAWLAGGLPELHTADAQRELVRAWLTAFGPGTTADLRWWSGLTAGEINRALKNLDTVAVDLDGEAGIVLAEHLEPPLEPEPWVALLPALDPTPMGWTGRAWYLGEHAPALFDRSGNVGPTVWSDGRIVGGWAQRKDGQIAVRLLEDVGREASDNIAATADRLGAWIGAVRLTPRFRTPLERELSA